MSRRYRQLHRSFKDRLSTSDFAGVAMIDRCHCEQNEFFSRTAGHANRGVQRFETGIRGSPRVSRGPAVREEFVLLAVAAIDHRHAGKVGCASQSFEGERMRWRGSARHE